MGSSAAASWNAEPTDAKGYWVATPDQAVERVDVDWPNDVLPTEERGARPLPKAKTKAPRSGAAAPAAKPGVAKKATEPRLPVAPIAARALPTELDEIAFDDVPEFTLSEKKSAKANRRAAAQKKAAALTPARWEVIDTLIPADAFDEPETEEAARPPASNVRVFARSQAFTEAITQDIPFQFRGDATGIGGNAPRAGVSLPEPAPVSVAPRVEAQAAEVPAAVHVEAASEAQMEAEATAPIAVPLSIEDKRALAKEMAARALAKAQSNPSRRGRSPGSLPPVESLLAPSQAPVSLPANAQESWSWDEADPLAVAEPAARRASPSLSVVQAPPGEDYEGVLATPMPAPPRPDVIVPWPLPMHRSVMAVHAGESALQAIDALDSISLPSADYSVDEGAFEDEALPAPSSSSVTTWLTIAGLFLGTGVAAMASLALFAVATVAVIVAA